MNDRKFHHIVGLLKSWESGYISPSAQMAIKDAREYLEELYDAYTSLDFELQVLKGRKEAGEPRDIEF